MASRCTSEQVQCYDVSLNPSHCVLASDFQCSMWASCDCPSIKADPDIAGQGVLYSFMVSAAATIVLSIACLILKEDYDAAQLNPIDKFFRFHVCRRLRNLFDPKSMERWANRLYAVILSLSDSQLVTGIAALASAIKLMNAGTITVYHFNLVSDLAWFSSNTHLTALLVLRVYTGSSKEPLKTPPHPNTQRSKHRFTNADVLKYIRVALMLILAVLLLYVSFLLGVESLYDNLNCPMNCVSSFAKGGKPLKWTQINFFFVLWSYPPAIVQIMPLLAQSWLALRSKIHARRESFLRGLDADSSAHVRKRIVYKGLTAVFGVLWQILASETESVVEGIGWFAFGVWSVVRDRDAAKTCRYGDDIPCMTAVEWARQNELGFGQLVPLFLLTLPLLSFVEAWDWDG